VVRASAATVSTERVVGPVMVVVLDPGRNGGEGLVEAGEVVGPDAFVLEGPVEPLDEGVAVGVPVGGPRQLDTESVGDVAVVVRGELGCR
jgi:hypothetical protein